MSTKIVKGITEKSNGTMRLVVEAGAVHRQKYFDKKHLATHTLVTAKLAHGNIVTLIQKGTQGETKEGCDGLITHDKGVILGVTVADCLPVYFWNIQKTVIGVAHVGWRGVRSEIVKEMVTVFVRTYLCNVRDICIEIGPHIKQCHFEIKNDLVEIFREHSESIKKVKEGTYLSLQDIVKKQLLAAGLEDRNIQLSSTCTYCSDQYFSYRRDKPKIIEAMLAYIVLE